MLSAALPSSTRLATCLFFSLCLAFSQIAYAKTPSDRQVNRLLDKSGITIQVDALPETIKLSLADTPAFVQQNVDKYFNVEDMQYQLFKAFKNKMTNAQVKEVVRWYTSPLGKRIATADEKMVNAEAMQTISEKMDELLANKEKVSLAKIFNKELAVSDINKNIMKNSFIAMSSAQMLQAGMEIDFVVLEDQADTMITAMEPELNKKQLASFVFAYQEFTEDELNQFLTAMRTPAMKKFNQVGSETLAELVETATAKLVLSFQ